MGESVYKYFQTEEKMDSIENEARALVQYVQKAVDNTYAFGYMTSSVYDTAWVSMIRKPGVDGKLSSLLFPECFQYVLDRQLPSGGWQESCHSTTDAIIDTLGGLLALKENSDLLHPAITPEILRYRQENAIEFLATKLENWDVGSCEHIAFEIIIPAMLEYLEKERVEFVFPGRSLLLELNQKKLAKIPASVWSGKMQSSIIHSLEAFIGKVDFAPLRSQLVEGSMGNSTSATAAYLMHCPDWDDNAESHLRAMLSTRKVEDHGGVPGVYPSTGFEVSWITSILLENGFQAADLPGIDSVITITDEFYHGLDGLSSAFSKSGLPDADDTAKSIVARNLLRAPTTADKMIQMFERPEHFVTFMMERNPSLSTNCNVLAALISSPDPERYSSQIEKCANFICSAWCARQTSVTIDKWNTSEFCPIMLISEGLMKLLRLQEKRQLATLPGNLIDYIVPLILFQTLFQTLLKQNADGSWGPTESPEATAYAVIALGSAASLPFVSSLLPQIRTAIERGRLFLSSHKQNPDLDRLWTGKILYSPIYVSRAYQLAALKMSWPKHDLGTASKRSLDVNPDMVTKYTKIFSMLPTLKDFPLWQVHGSVIEGCLILKKLNRDHCDLFNQNGRTGIGTGTQFDTGFFEMAAMIFSCASNLSQVSLGADTLYTLIDMAISTFELDDYGEHLIGRQYAHCTATIKQAIEDMFQGEALNNASDSDRDNIISESAVTSNADERVQAEELAEIISKLERFARSILHLAKVSTAGVYEKDMLKLHLKRHILSHLVQIDDNRFFEASSNNKRQSGVPRGCFYSWVHSHLNPHLFLSFLQCLLSHRDRPFSQDAVEKYIIQDLTQHFSVKARMENDRPSFARDRRENDLNSLDFPEFNLPEEKTEDKNAVSVAKEQLSRLVDYEKKCWDLGMAALQETSAGRAESTDMVALLFFDFVSDLYGELYTLRDR